MTGAISVALLRGINVGGKHRVSMESLRQVFGQAGFPGARTYIQSGNVIFPADVRGAERSRVAMRLAAAAELEFGFPVPFVLRTVRELEAVIRKNPYVAEGIDPAALHVLFAATPIAARSARALDPNRSPPDRFHVAGDVVFLACPNGVARTKLTTGFFDQCFGSATTVRNWKTVNTLLAVAREGT